MRRTHFPLSPRASDMLRDVLLSPIVGASLISRQGGERDFPDRRCFHDLASGRQTRLSLARSQADFLRILSALPARGFALSQEVRLEHGASKHARS